MRGRERGIGLIPILAYGMVIFGARRSELFEASVIPGTIGLVAAVGLFVWARLATQGRRFSYIGNTDTPEFICTDGPYRWIRHPFYSSYLITLVSVALLFPNAITIIGTIAGILGFTRSAKFEEAKFDNSPLAAEYHAYMKRSGRFLPGL
jgi:protein-S-isoprenylcysteine O-methyltransferase Ste14